MGRGLGGTEERLRPGRATGKPDWSSRTGEDFQSAHPAHLLPSGLRPRVVMRSPFIQVQSCCGSLEPENLTPLSLHLSHLSPALHKHFPGLRSLPTGCPNRLPQNPPPHFPCPLPPHPSRLDSCEATCVLNSTACCLPGPCPPAPGPHWVRLSPSYTTLLVAHSGYWSKTPQAR